MRNWLWILLALVVVVAIAVVRMPARLVSTWFLPRDAAVHLEDVSGTLWKGQAGRVLHDGIDQGRLDWRLGFWSLLIGRIDTSLTLAGPDVSAAARVVRQGDSVRITGAHATLPANRLDPVLDIPALHLVGNVRINLDALEIRGHVPVLLHGSAEWRDAGVTGQDNASFGTLTARFGPMPGGGFGGTVADDGGPLAVEGEFKTTLLGYEARATLRPREDNPQVTRALRHIGQIQADGSVLFHVTGGLIGASR
ncbi:type II secretion system protein N [Xanthomonadaceae bacterium JHOS43]|nr:type II secretion system protein N [Xanthomonadaceae bacterium JHOS43]MCX7562946.1 type II secretion system protein N [Xanthomonadaceae bacterium XH05]